MTMRPICILNQNAPAETFVSLERLGFQAIPLPPHPDLAAGEAAHADMQFCKIPGETLVYAPGTSPAVIKALQERNISVTKGQTRLKPDYPENIAYNILIAGKLYFHNLPFTDSLASSLLAEKGYRGVKVRQGYAACSAIAITAEHILTGDRGLMAAAEEQGIETIFVSDKEICLPGFDHGFAGGCCGVFGNTLYTCGELPRAVCGKLAGRGISVVPLCAGLLTDIGGLLFL